MIRTKDITPFPHTEPYNILIPGGNSASLRQSVLHIVTMHGIWSLNVGLLDIRLLTAMLYCLPWASVTPDPRKSQKITNARARKTLDGLRLRLPLTRVKNRSARALFSKQCNFTAAAKCGKLHSTCTFAFLMYFILNFISFCFRWESGALPPNFCGLW